MTGSIRRLLGALVGLTLLLLALGVPAAEASSSGQDAYVRAAHFSPDTGGVDVYLTSFSGNSTTLWLSNVGYGAVSPYERLQAGTYAVSMRPHGAAASTPPVLTYTLNATPGSAYTVAGVGMNKDLHAVLLQDQLSQPPAGQASVRVIQAASRAPAADVSAVDGPTIASGVAFGTATSYAQIPAKNWTVKASGPGGQPSAQASVSVPSGAILSIVVLDSRSGSGIELQTVLDAAGAAAMPDGSVPAGGGGTASGAGQSVPILATVLAAAAVLLALAGLGVRVCARRP